MAIRFFSKITTDEYNDIVVWLNKADGLYWKIVLTAYQRASRINNKITGLDKGEFYLSETETEKFGLKKTQHGKIRRSIMKLICIKLISKTGNKTGNNNSCVYSVNKGFMDFMDYSTGSKNKNKQGTDREQTGNEQGENNSILDCNREYKNKEKSNKKENEVPEKFKGKKKYLDYVYLSDEEYQELKERFGKTIVDSEIENLDTWFTENPKKFKASKSHKKRLISFCKTYIEKNPTKTISKPVNIHGDRTRKPQSELAEINTAVQQMYSVDELVDYINAHDYELTKKAIIKHHGQVMFESVDVRFNRIRQEISEQINSVKAGL
jgi:hypothetical protein